MGSNNPSISFPDGMVDEIDQRRESTTSRSRWVAEAVKARFDAEDVGEWSTPELGGASTAVTDGGTPE